MSECVYAISRVFDTSPPSFFVKERIKLAEQSRDWARDKTDTSRRVLIPLETGLIYIFDF